MEMSAVQDYVQKIGDTLLLLTNSLNEPAKLFYQFQSGLHPLLLPFIHALAVCLLIRPGLQTKSFHHLYLPKKKPIFFESFEVEGMVLFAGFQCDCVCSGNVLETNNSSQRNRSVGEIRPSGGCVCCSMVHRQLVPTGPRQHDPLFLAIQSSPPHC